MLACLVWACVGTFGLAQGRAELRLAHMSPDAPRLDVVVDGELMARDISFTQLSDYLTVEAGERQLEVYPHRPPAPTGDAATPWGEGRPKPITPLTLTVDLTTGGRYTVVAAGFFDPIPTDSGTGDLVIETADDITVDVTGPGGFSHSGAGQIRLQELVPGAYTVNAAKTGFESAEYAVEILADVTLTLPITLQVADADTAPAPEQPQRQARDVTWQRVQLQLYEDTEKETPAQALEGSTRLRVIHTSPVTPSLDLTLTPLTKVEDDTFGWQNLSFPNETDYAELPAASYDATMTQTGTELVLGEVRSLPLEAGVSYTLYVVGSLTDSYVALIPSVDKVD